MGGFLGIGKSSEERALEEQKRMNALEVEKSRRDDEIRLAERKAKKGQETAKVKLGTTQEELSVSSEKKTKEKAPKSMVSQSLGLGGGSGKTGVQL